MRQTKQRQAILDLLRSSHSHPTADWVYDEVRKVVPHISRGTVYRNLRVLRETGEISELDLCGTISRFEGHHEPHYHFRCRQCGRVFDIDEPVNEDLNKRVSARTGFTVEYHHLEFHGVCHDCQRQQSISAVGHEKEVTR